jgi:phenol hydroxylase P2 protein
MSAAPKTEPMVFIALQTNDDTRPIIEAIEADNPHAIVNKFPAMVKIDAPSRLVVRRESIEERVGRDFDLRELQINLISIGGNIEETEDEFILHWRTA